ncbi:hypothetical protein ElyMa_006497700 [Elysia marginata]|uniref:Ig-like domain-containing protein n=1 Tax=Elysia marginata TaxID=1093978 RepID=A0AAV4I7B8_9GAST|nr:hypothetical protein ElyMa_006497700 [Elysia marginata]
MCREERADYGVYTCHVTDKRSPPCLSVSMLNMSQCQHNARPGWMSVWLPRVGQHWAAELARRPPLRALKRHGLPVAFITAGNTHDKLQISSRGIR